MVDFGTLVAFDLPGGEKQLPLFLDSLGLFHLTASLGSTDSLVAPCDLFFARDLSQEERKKAGISPGTVRLSLGLEDADDLIADLEQALKKSSI